MLGRFAAAKICGGPKDYTKFSGECKCYKDLRCLTIQVSSTNHKDLRRLRIPQIFASVQNATKIYVSSEYHTYLRRIRISHIFASFQITKKIYVDLQSQRFVSSQLRQLRLQWRFASAQNTINVYVSSEFSKGLRQLSVP